MRVSETMVFAAVIAGYSFFELPNVSVNTVDQNSLAAIRGGVSCYKQDSFECKANVAPSTCGATACVLGASGFYYCPNRPQCQNAVLPVPPPPPQGPNPINTSKYYEVISNTIGVCNESSSGVTNKTPGPMVACQVVYQCYCNEYLPGNCLRQVNLYYESYDDRRETGCWGGICPD